MLRVTKSPVVIIVSGDEEAGPSGTERSERPKSPLLGATRVSFPRPVARVQEVPLVRCQEEVDDLRETTAMAKRDKAFSDPTSENKVDYDECRFGPNRPNMLRVLPNVTSLP